tara:strand:+ start:368 stop:526 length:159 start_codon:yes stop_codon:yes gene_type:complete
MKPLLACLVLLLLIDGGDAAKKKKKKADASMVPAGSRLSYLIPGNHSVPYGR